MLAIREEEEATPKISNRALLVEELQLPPPLHLSPRMARFSSPTEVTIMTLCNHKNNKNKNKTTSISNNTTLDESPWASLTSSLLVLCSKPFFYYCMQAFLSPRKLHTFVVVQPTTTATAEGGYQIKGLRNYGQTCYLNSVLQALASLKPVRLYLERLGQCRNLQQQQSSLSALVGQVLQHLNGNAACPNVHWILEKVATQHAPFQSAVAAIGKHPQDAEELLQTLLNMIAQEAELVVPWIQDNNDDNNDEEDTVISSFHLKPPRQAVPAAMFPPKDSTTTATTTTSTSSDYETPRTEEKKQDEFDVFIPRIDSEEDMNIPIHRIEAAPLDTETMSDISSKDIMRSTVITTRTFAISPMSCWVGSALQCRSCQHRRPIHNTPIHSIPVVPLAVSQSLKSVVKTPDNNTSPSCRLEDCLAEFTAVEVVQDVECRSCTIKEKKSELLEDIAMFQQAIQSQSSSSRKIEEDLQHLQHELNQAIAKLRAINSIDPDDDDAPLEDVFCSEEFGSYNDSIPIRRGSAYKRMLLTRLPTVLTIHVQRRYYDPYTNRMTKTSQHVLFPEILDVAPYCAHGGISFSERILAQDARNHPIPYRLSSVIEHQGNAFYGHYVCYRRHPTSGQWYFTSDLTVKKVSWNEVSRCQAYLLFYESCS